MVKMKNIDVHILTTPKKVIWGRSEIHITECVCVCVCDRQTERK